MRSGVNASKWSLSVMRIANRQQTHYIYDNSTQNESILPKKKLI